MFNIIRVTVAALTLLVASSALSSSAEAQLRICNKSNSKVSIAAAYESNGTFSSHGWYSAEAGECVTVVSGALRQRYYYIHAHSTSLSWGDDYSACTLTSAFEISGSSNCDARGYGTRSFFRIDTGSDAYREQNLTVSAPVATSNYLDGLRFGWRNSLVDTTRTVLQVRSDRSYASSVRVRCYTNDGYSKVIAVSVPAGGLSEIGYLEGWDGNFVPGEYCNVLQGDEAVRRLNAPTA